MTSPHTTHTDLLTDFHKILALFDKETQIYKQQISILTSSINELQNNDGNRINMISRELSELRTIINSIDHQPPADVDNRPTDADNIPEDNRPEDADNRPEDNRPTDADNIPEDNRPAEIELVEEAPINPSGNIISFPNGTSGLTDKSGKSRDINDYLCQICLDLPRDCLLEPCMHFCVCVRCVKLLIEPKCPVCRRTIEFYQNVFIL